MVLFTAEHAGNKVPKEYKHLFKSFSSLLQTHCGLDIGTWYLVENLENKIVGNTKLFRTDITRLLVDVNRSLWRKTLFSEVTKTLPNIEKEKILEKYYYAYRQPIYDFVKRKMAGGYKIIHIAVHSFTPNLKGEERNTDIGLLYNPERANENNFCKNFKNTLNAGSPQWRARFNYPYRGKPDGLTAHFRKYYPDRKYLGIELELNQKYATENGQFPKQVHDFLSQTLSETIKSYQWL